MDKLKLSVQDGQVNISVDGVLLATVSPADSSSVTPFVQRILAGYSSGGGDHLLRQLLDVVIPLAFAAGQKHGQS